MIAVIVIFGVGLILPNVFHDSEVSYDSDTDEVPATREQAPPEPTTTSEHNEHHGRCQYLL